MLPDAGKGAKGSLNVLGCILAGQFVALMFYSKIRETRMGFFMD